MMIQPKQFTCPSCGASLQQNAPGNSVHIVCKSCGSQLDVTHPMVRLIQKYEKVMSRKPEIPIGSFITLKNIKWKVIGFIIREDKDYSFEWKEYQLYNPYHGFPFLLNLDDHFSFVTTLQSLPFEFNLNFYNNMNSLPQLTVSHLGVFEVFNRGKAQITFAIGEFSWQVKIGQKVKMHDYINPPYMLTVEEEDQELQISISEYIPFKDILIGLKDISALSLNTPWKITANQLNPYQEPWPKIKNTWMIGLAVLFCCGFYFNLLQKQTLVYNRKIFESSVSSMPNTMITETFQIQNKSGNLGATIYSPVSNQWVELDVDLVNETTGENYPLRTGVEYYSGSDYDGSWSEGSTTNDTIVSGIPGGTYHAEISAASDKPIPYVNLNIQRNTSMWMNFFVALLSLSIYPMWCLWRRRSFEMSRWENSDYTKYNHEQTFLSLIEDNSEI